MSGCLRILDRWRGCSHGHVPRPPQSPPVVLATEPSNKGSRRHPAGPGQSAAALGQRTITCSLLVVFDCHPPSPIAKRPSRVFRAGQRAPPVWPKLDATRSRALLASTSETSSSPSMRATDGLMEPAGYARGDRNQGKEKKQPDERRSAPAHVRAPRNERSRSPAVRPFPPSLPFAGLTGACKAMEAAQPLLCWPTRPRRKREVGFGFRPCLYASRPPTGQVTTPMTRIARACRVFVWRQRAPRGGGDLRQVRG